MKYVIVGAVAGGAGTAARLRRLDEKADIVIFEKGHYISYANCGLPYYIGGVINERNKLFVQTATSFSKRFRADVRVRSEVISIDRALKTVNVLDHQTGKQYSETYDKLVLSPGAEPVRPPLPGVDFEGIFTLRNVTDTDYIKEYISERKPAHAVVVGAGFIGLEMAENLFHAGVKVSVVEMAGQILAPLDFPIAAIVQRHIRSKGVELNLNTSVSRFERQDGRLKVCLKDGGSIETDLVILSVGVRPDSKLAAQAGLRLGEHRGIWVNEFLQTSDPDIYAVGDAIEFPDPLTGKYNPTYLAGPANKQGRICANNLVNGNRNKYAGSLNTAIVKVFDMTVGATGMASKQLSKEGILHLVSTTHSGSHAGYYPGAQQLTIQLAFSSGGELYGAQVAGYKGVDKRLDVLASVIKQKGTIEDLAEFEHAYAPPFSSAKDPVNMAGFVAGNILEGKLKVIYADPGKKFDEDLLLIDVRTPGEYAVANIPGSINIPVDDLRDRLGELPRERRIVIYCQIGLRGYIAQRILVQNGFTEVYNLSGGFLLWNIMAEELELLASPAAKLKQGADL